MTSRVPRELPPWLEGSGIVFSSGSEPSPAPANNVSASAVSPPPLLKDENKGPPEAPVEEETSEATNPPWLAAALESGVIFYDPEGKEVVVPSSQVGAFKAGLDSVSGFEQSTKGILAPTTSAADAASPEEGQSTAAQSPSSSEGLKTFVRMRFFALVRGGLEPNTAAARAIREAATFQAQAAGQQRAEHDEVDDQNASTASSQSPPGSSRSSHQTCASSLKDGTAEEKRTVNKEVSVIA